MIVNMDTGRIVARNPGTALSLKHRFLGLMGKRFPWRDYDALVFPSCRSIHTFFMLAAIDVIFLDRESRIVKVCRAVAPWRISLGGRRTYWTVELPVGCIDLAQCLDGHRLNMNMEFSDAAEKGIGEALAGVGSAPGLVYDSAPGSIAEKPLQLR